MLKRTWIIKENDSKNIFKVLLKNRNITNEKEFINPPHPTIFDLNSVGIDSLAVSKAKKRIEKAISKKETVVIFGDYDVDGTCATSLLWTTFHKMGMKVYPFIPDRFLDGYGMSVTGIEKILQKYKETSLIVAVDNGIVAHEAIAFAKKKKIDIIVYDHHEKRGENNAYAVIHTTQLCGTAVVWFFVREFGLSDGLDLVAIATVSDQMKLLGVNRALVSHGLYELQKTKRPGLLALAQVSEIDVAKIGTYEIGFVLGPRINAAGRIANALDVVRLLCTTKLHQAIEIAVYLDELNTKRQLVLKETIIAVQSQISETHKFIIVVGEFHEGVIGLVASKIVEQTGKPALVLSKSKDKLKGSGRSIVGFHLTEALTKFSHLLSSVGGHEMAAGLTILPENLEQFTEEFLLMADSLIEDTMLERKLTIDCKISFNDITDKLSDEIDLIAPFGIGNPKPIFVTEAANIKEIKYMGKEKQHIKFLLSENKVSKEAVLFNSYEKEPFKIEDEISIVYSIDKNAWNNHVNVQLILKDYILSDGGREKTTRTRVSKA